MTDYIEVVTTIDKRSGAEELARALVEERLAACVQVRGPIQSTYRWKGQIETAEEWQCVAKSRADLFDRVDRAIRRLHPYEVPEILALPIAAASQSYLSWMAEELAEA